MSVLVHKRPQNNVLANIVEMDRLKYAAEQYGYSVRLMRIDGDHHDPLLYGKGDILLASAPRGAFSVDTLACL